MTEEDTFNKLRKWGILEIQDAIENYTNDIMNNLMIRVTTGRGPVAAAMIGSRVELFANKFIVSKGWTIDEYVHEHIKIKNFSPWWRAY
jgi:hypothetical protein